MGNKATKNGLTAAPPQPGLLAKTGPKLWHKLHTHAIGWHHRPTREEIENEKKYLIEFFEELSCSRCERHAVLYYLNNQPNLKNGAASYSMWVYIFHNEVNKRLGKPNFAYHDYQELYRQQLVRAGLC
jgi:hypothetical protein